MHIIIIAGLSKGMGGQLSMKHEYVLTREGSVMTYNNLLSYFGSPTPAESLADYNAPYRAGIHLFNCVRQQGYECTLINFLDLEENFFQEAAGLQPDVVAISTTFLINIQSVRRVTEFVKRHAPHAKIVLGGPLVYNSYLLYLKRGTDYDLESCRRDYYFIDDDSQYTKEIDFFVIEEQGETSFIRLIKTLETGGDPSQVPNLAFYKNGDLTLTMREAENNDFSADLINWQQVPARYLYPIYPVRGSRGCPYRCKYCNFSTHRSFSIKPHDVLEKELAALSDSGRVQILRFTDDNLFLNRKNLEAFCETIIKARGHMKWTSFIRANSITRENVSLLKESGCLLAQIGVESGDAGMLTRMNKNEEPDDYLEAIELLNSQGIFTQLYFIVGFPGETQATLDNTVRLINQFKHDGPAINFIMVFPFIFAPLSLLYSPESRTEFGLKGYMFEWQHNTMDSKQAAKHARDLLLRIDNVYPFYGIEEIAVLDITTLKKLSDLRLALRKAEIFHASPSDIDRMWNELRHVVTKTPTIE